MRLMVFQKLFLGCVAVSVTQVVALNDGRSGIASGRLRRLDHAARVRCESVVSHFFSSFPKKITEPCIPCVWGAWLCLFGRWLLELFFLFLSVRF